MVILIPVSFVQAASFFNESSDVTKFIKQVYWFGAAIVGGAALLGVVLAGVNYMRSAGNEETVKKSKEILATSLIGLFMVMTSYVVLNTLDPRLVNPSVEVVEVQGVNPWEGTKTCYKHADCGDTSKYKCKKYRNDSTGKYEMHCTTLVKGSTKTGKSCSADDECESGICVNIGTTECAPAGGQLATKKCLRDEDCKSGICEDNFRNKCTEDGGNPARGDCSKDYHCQSKKCNTAWSNSCTEPGGDPEGKACVDHNDCKGGYCNTAETMAKCKALGTSKAGDSCDNDQECATKYCNKEHARDQCIPENGEDNGAECDRDVECKKNSRCSSSGKCVSK